MRMEEPDWCAVVIRGGRLSDIKLICAVTLCQCYDVQCCCLPHYVNNQIRHQGPTQHNSASTLKGQQLDLEVLQQSHRPFLLLLP
jgi:hypothetical protein